MDALKLNEDDLPLLQERIANLHPGTYELSQILDDLWDAVESKTKAGQKFSKFVSEGRLEGVESAGRGSDNHQRYRID